MVKIPHTQIKLRKLLLFIFVSFSKIVALLFGGFTNSIYLWRVKQ